MKLIMALFLVGMLLIAATAAAQNDPFKTLLAARSLKCQMGSGSVAKWSGPKVSVEKDTLDSVLHFDSIDTRAGKARLIANQGAGDVTVWATASGITFVEQTSFGNLAFTTVFSAQVPGTNDFYAVTSRHMAMLSGSPLPSQYHGRCKVWQ